MKLFTTVSRNCPGKKQNYSSVHHAKQFRFRFLQALCERGFDFGTETMMRQISKNAMKAGMSMKDKMLKELDPLELRCLSLAARGRTREDITRETDISHERIDEAFTSAMEKLQASNVAEAVFRAARMELIS